MNKNDRCGFAIFKSDQKELHADTKVIIALLKKQPQKLEELCKNAGIDRSTFYRMRRLLIRSGVLKETDRGYALWFYSSIEDKVKEALENFRDEGYETVSLNDLANRIGEHPRKIERMAYKLASEYGIRIDAFSRKNRGLPYLRRTIG